MRILTAILFLLTGLFAACNSSQPEVLKADSTESSQFVLKQSTTPLKLSITPSEIFLGQSANISIRTAPYAMVKIDFIPPGEELQVDDAESLMSNSFNYTLHSLSRLSADKQLRAADFEKLISKGTPLSDKQGIFSTTFSDQPNMTRSGNWRIIAYAETIKNPPPLVGFPISGNMTVVVGSLLVK